MRRPPAGYSEGAWLRLCQELDDVLLDAEHGRELADVIRIARRPLDAHVDPSPRRVDPEAEAALEALVEDDARLRAEAGELLPCGELVEVTAAGGLARRPLYAEERRRRRHARAAMPSAASKTPSSSPGRVRVRPATGEVLLADGSPLTGVTVREDGRVVRLASTGATVRALGRGAAAGRAGAGTARARGERHKGRSAAAPATLRPPRPSVPPGARG